MEDDRNDTFQDKREGAPAMTLFHSLSLRFLILTGPMLLSSVMPSTSEKETIASSEKH